MKETRKKRKKARFGIEAAYGRQWLDDQMFRILVTGKQGFDAMMKGMGRMMAETIMYIVILVNIYQLKHSDKTTQIMG